MGGLLGAALPPQGTTKPKSCVNPRYLDSGQERDCTSLAGALGHQAPGSRDSLGQDTRHHTLGFQEHSVLSLTSALTVAPVIRNIEIKWNSSDEEIITALEMVQPFLSDHIRAFLFNQQFWFLIPFVHVGDREEVMRPHSVASIRLIRAVRPHSQLCIAVRDCIQQLSFA